MPSDNPFAEPDDTDRTEIIRPMPGGRAARSGPVVEPPAVPPPASAVAGPEMVRVGINPLAAAAAPLLQLLSRLRNTLSQPDAGELRDRAAGEMRRFEQAAREVGVPMEQLRPAHYALCASLDDVVLATPWGNESPWAARSLISTFHQEVRSGDRFFDLLKQVKQHPGRFLAVIELMYLCLSLGFQGRYRLSPRGPAELDRLREEVYAVIARQRSQVEPELSASWRGVSAPYRPMRAELPVWVAGAAGAAAIAALFVWFAFGLNGRSDALFARMAQAAPATMPVIVRAPPNVKVPPPAPPPEQGALDRLTGFLHPEIVAGKVAVLGTEAAPVVRIRNSGLAFASGSATVADRYVPLLQRIGEALGKERGPVQVIGYTDNQPIRSVLFPSNYQLSAARARAAAAVIARTIDSASRISTEGRADADPIANNATAAGREENRRIEVVLRREG